MEFLIIIIFILGYSAIAFEHPLKINKTASALLTGVLCWTLFAIQGPSESLLSSLEYQTFSAHIINLTAAETYRQFVQSALAEHLSEISSILFFLIGAMTIVELIDAHDGFQFITDMIKTRSVRRLLWIVCWLTFFLSAVLDNLTTSIVMISLIRKLVPSGKTRLLFAGMVIIAANAGGAWSPIGDVTTTMLWIGGQITSLKIMQQLIVPSMVCLLIPLVVISFQLKGKLAGFEIPQKVNSVGKGGKIMLAVGVGILLFVPVFKTLTHLPPYMGILLGLGIVWVVSELINPGLDEGDRKQYSASGALSRIDVSSVLFFFGILLAVAALQSMQTLHHFATYLSELLGDNRIIVTVIGLTSAILDNVPLVAACMGMYSLDMYPQDHMIWEYLAYCAGTGGSLLIIGSAAGVAVMGMEKIDFMWYLKKMSFLALIGYAAGAFTYLLIFN
ncbi:sodium:proton antiporter NhaD [soil metagenome]